MAPALLQAPSSRPLKTSLDDAAQAAEDSARSTDDESDVLTIEGLQHTYRKSIWASRSAPHRKTLADLSLAIGHGEVLALIGESGSGKSTLARCIVGLESTQAGCMDFDGYDLARPGRRPVSVSRKLQIVFQNIAGSLHPGKLIREILRRPYELYERRRPADDELAALVQSVGLKEQYLAKRSPALSGGERQRVAIARATSSSPSLIVLDEAFSALDVSMKVKVMRLLQERRATTRMSLLLITHDLPIVRFMADRVAVLYRGWLCEVGPRRIIESPPMHPYTEALMWSALGLEGLRPRHLDLVKMGTTDRTGGQPTAIGCPYRGRCPRYLGAQCDAEAPPFQEVAAGHQIACHIPINELRDVQASEWTARELSKDLHVG